MTPHEQNICDMTAKSCAVAFRAFAEGAPEPDVLDCWRSAAEVARYNLPGYVADRFAGFVVPVRAQPYTSVELGAILVETLIDIYSGGSC